MQYRTVSQLPKIILSVRINGFDSIIPAAEVLLHKIFREESSYENILPVAVPKIIAKDFSS